MTLQDYSSRTEYRPPVARYQRLNRLGEPLTSLGLAPRGAARGSQPVSTFGS
jgi:hypothetical protein